MRAGIVMKDFLPKQQKVAVVGQGNLHTLTLDEKEC